MTDNTRRYEQMLIAYPHDGLVDVMVGLSLAFVGVTLILNASSLTPIVVICMLFLLRGVRARWIMPRLTPEELESATSTESKWAILALKIGLTALLLLGILAFILVESDALDDVGETGWLVFAVGMLVVIIVGVGVLVGKRHWFVYAIITAMLAGTIAAFSLPFEVGVTIVGLPMTLYGLWMLRQFFNEHHQLASQD